MLLRILIILSIIGLTALFFLDLGHGPDSAIYQLYGFAHITFFAFAVRLLVGLPALTRQPFWLQIVWVMSVVFIAGGIIELVQPYFGRSASWHDMEFNLLGGFLGLMFLAPARHSLRRSILGLGQFVALTLLVMLSYGPLTTLWDMRQASTQFPMLGDFETRRETKRWSSGEIDREFFRHGQASLMVPLETDKKYTGTTLRRSFGNWTGYSFMAFSVHNPGPEPLYLTVSIRDHEHFHRGGEYNDRFNRSFRIEQGWNEILIPIADIENAPAERTLELDSLSEVVFFTTEQTQPRIIHLDHVRLIP